MENKKNIFEALNSIMQDGVVIEKIKKSQQGYNFRGIDQVLTELQPLFAKHGVFVIPCVLDITREERTTTKGSLVIYTIIKMKYTFYSVDGSFVEAVVVGEAMDSGDKSCNKCMSVAFKYACFQVLCIPTEETTQDPDDNCDKLAPKKTTIKIEFITTEQQEEFRKICILNKIDSEKLLKACKIENIEKMQVSTFNKIKSSISTLVEKYPIE